LFRTRFGVPNNERIIAPLCGRFVRSVFALSISSFSLGFAGRNGQLRYLAAFSSGHLGCPCLPALAGNLSDVGIG
jgi:hypothetical protein